MDVSQFDVPLFAPNIVEINFDIFNLWLEGFCEEDVAVYLWENVLHSQAGEDEDDGDEKEAEYNMGRVLEQTRNAKFQRGTGRRFQGNKGEQKEEKKEEEKKRMINMTVLLKKEEKAPFRNHDNKVRNNEFDKYGMFFKRIKGINETEKMAVKAKSMKVLNLYKNDLMKDGTLLFHYFLFLYIKHQFYLYTLISHHLGNLDLRFSHLIVPLHKNIAQKLVVVYYNIDINLEKEVIKYKNINNISKDLKYLARVTNIHEVSIRRQIENIKNLWKYILNIYEQKHINISALYKKKKLSFKRIIKYIKTNFLSYKHLIKKEKVVDIEDNANMSVVSSISPPPSFPQKKRKNKLRKRRDYTVDSDEKNNENNIIKILESLIGATLAKRYFQLYWIIVHHIETPKKLSISYDYFNKIILLLVEKLEIHDLILSKEYIFLSKKIYTIYKNGKRMDELKTDLFSITEHENNKRNRRLHRVKCIFNFLCCFRNSFEIRKLFLLYVELNRSEFFQNEQEFMKKYIGNNIFVKRVFNFIRDAEYYTSHKGMTNTSA